MQDDVRGEVDRVTADPGAAHCGSCSALSRATPSEAVVSLAETPPRHPKFGGRVRYRRATAFF
jgi:hypothetical protein